MTIRCRLILLAVLALALAACAHSGSRKSPSVTVTTEAFDFFSGDFENTAAIKKNLPRAVAVLPFTGDPADWSGVEKDEDPTVIVRRGFYNQFASLPFQDLELAETDARLANAGLDAAAVESLLAENPKKLGSILGVDAVVLGRVTHFDRVYMGVASQVAVGCKVRMVSLETGDLLWRAEHVERGFGGGVSLSPVGLILNAAAALWNLRGVELLRQTDDLFREMVQTVYLPESMRAARIAPPSMDLFAVVSEGPYRAGQKVVLRMVGDAGGRAWADLGDYKSGIVLSPASPEAKAALQAELLERVKEQYSSTGHELTPALLQAVRDRLAQREVYEGSYTVQPGEEAKALLAKGSLAAADGGKATMIDAVTPVDIDAVPPRAPAGLRAEPLDRKVRLFWGGNREKDLAAYQVWASDSQLSGYRQLAVVETPAFTVTGLTNFQDAWYKVMAVDRAGNVSEESHALRASASPVTGLAGLPSPGPNLGGEITEKVVLEAAKNPFVVRQDLVIAPGGSLYIEPGVELRFTAGTSLRVEGGDILAFGRPDAPVRLVPAAGPDARPGTWRGVVLDGAVLASLTNVVIEGASTGLTVAQCAPELEALTITGSAQAGLHLKDYAKPSLTCSRIAGNGGMGGLVLEGKGLAPNIRQTTFADNQPFDVQSFVPVFIDLAGNWWGGNDPAMTTIGLVQFAPPLDAAPQACPQP